MVNVFQQYGLTGIWHFTDRKNLELIKLNGLLSIAEIARRQILVPAPGGNQWSHDADRFKSLDDYVHLTFVPDHPMLFIAKNDGRITDPVWLKINPNIALVPGVLFTNDVSNKHGVIPMSSSQAATQIDFEVLLTRMDWRDSTILNRRRNAIKSEILIPRIVGISDILEVHNG